VRDASIVGSIGGRSHRATLQSLPRKNSLKQCTLGHIVACAHPLNNGCWLQRLRGPSLFLTCNKMNNELTNNESRRPRHVPANI